MCCSKPEFSIGLLFPRDSPQMTKPEYTASDAPFRKGAPRWESTILSTELTWRRQWWRGFVEGSPFVCFRSAHRQVRDCAHRRLGAVFALRLQAVLSFAVLLATGSATRRLRLGGRGDGAAGRLAGVYCRHRGAHPGSELGACGVAADWVQALLYAVALVCSWLSRAEQRR